MIGVPTLAEVVNDPDLVETLPPTVCGALLIEAGVVTSRLGARIALAPAVGGASNTSAAPDRVLTLAECATRLRLSVGTARLRFQTPPWSATVVERSKTRVLVSEARFDALLRDGLQVPSHRPARRAGGSAGPRIGRPQTAGLGRGAR